MRRALWVGTWTTDDPVPFGFVEPDQAPTRVRYQEGKFFTPDLRSRVGPPPTPPGGGLYRLRHGGDRQSYAGLPATQRGPRATGRRDRRRAD